MQLIQIILILFFVGAIYKVFERKKTGDLSVRSSVLWIIFWIISGVVVLVPDSTFYLAKIFGVGRGADMVVYFSLAGLFFIVFRLMIKIEKLNREITSIVRDKAIKEQL